MSALSREAIKLDLPNFKSSSINYNISLHDPDHQGVMYLRTLIYNLARNLTEDQWNLLDKTEGRDKGYPIAVICKDRSVCLDYLQAVFEVSFMSKYVDLTDKSVMEVGAGYGRTAHTILSNYDVKSYTIVDLENLCALSFRYLKEVLAPEQLVKVKWIPIEHGYPKKDHDIAICIDVFAELDEGEAEYYVRYAQEHCKYFYLKMPVGRYAVGVKLATETNPRITKLYLNESYDDINTMDESEILTQIPKFLKKFKPKGWSCLGDSQAQPFMQYWQAMYSKEKK